MKTRTSSVLAAVAALIGSLALPASATTTTTVVKSIATGNPGTAGAPKLHGVPCAQSPYDGQLNPGGSAPFTRIGAPADPAAIPTVSWGTYLAGANGAAWGIPTAPGGADALQVFSLDVYNGSTGYAVVTASDGTGIWLGKAPITGATHAWTTINAAPLAYTWSHFSPGSVYADSSVVGVGIADFAAGQTAVTGYSGSIAFGCDGQDFRYQHLQAGTAANPTITDFGHLANVMGINNNFAAWGYPNRVPFRVSGGSLYRASKAILSSRTLPDVTYQTRTLTLDPGDGVDDIPCWQTALSTTVCNQYISVDLFPLHNTIYKWTIPAGNGLETANSGYKLVHVQVELKPLFPKGLPKDEPFKISGTSVPAKPGATVRLIAECGPTFNNNPPVQLATTKIRSDGSWTVIGTLPDPDHCVVYLKVDKLDSANEAGQSGSVYYNFG